MLNGGWTSGCLQWALESGHAGHTLPMSFLHGRKMAGQIIAGTSLASTFGYYTPPAGMGPFVDHGCAKDQRVRPFFCFQNLPID